QLAQRAIAAIDLRHFKRPLRIIRHLKPVRRIEQKRDRRVRRSTRRMLLSEAQKLIGNAAEGIQLKRIVTRSGFEKLIPALFEIDRRRARHVIKEITLAIPRERRSHRWTITRVIEI